MVAVLGLAVLGLAGAASAQTVFIPPNDPVGHVFTTNSNDGWAVSRGVVFQVTSTQTLSSIGLLQDLTGVTVSYEVDQITSASGNVGPGKSILRSGSATFTTSGLQFITFSIAPLTLQAGNFYLIRFQFSGNSNQNFFYDNNNVAFSQSGFAQIDGTENDDTGNSVMPSIEVNSSGPVASATAVPALSRVGLALLGLLLTAGTFFALRRRS
ncbi:MAG TPA: hypothetical protein VJQ49_11300 [Casimicrobiaceae bacterium]|nr:hypothetical protein [Casimicrobiaceae bacterium]